MNQFRESLNTAVFTTTFVVQGKSITYVSHEEEDGAWQFFSDDEFVNYEDVAVIVCLGEVITIDETILQLWDLPVGFKATRADIYEDWQISPL